MLSQQASELGVDVDPRVLGPLAAFVFLIFTFEVVVSGLLSHDLLQRDTSGLALASGEPSNPWRGHFERPAKECWVGELIR